MSLSKECNDTIQLCQIDDNLNIKISKEFELKCENEWAKKNIFPLVLFGPYRSGKSTLLNLLRHYFIRGENGIEENIPQKFIAKKNSTGESVTRNFECLCELLPTK